MANWDDIRVFLGVARAGSLSRAAPRLRMDAATVSRRIARLERDLDDVLFVKSPQGYVLSGAGQRLLERAALAEESLSAALAQPGEGLQGTVRIGAPDGCANFLLPQICAQLQAQNPGLELQILALPRIVNLSRREADLAITVSPPETKRLHVTLATDYRLHLAARHDCADGLRELDDLRTLPHVGYIADMIFDQELDYASQLPVDGTPLASNSVSVQLQLLRARPSVGVVHDFALPFAPELRPVLTDLISLERRFYVVQHAGDHRSRRMQGLVQALGQGLRDEVTRLEALAHLQASDLQSAPQ